MSQTATAPGATVAGVDPRGARTAAGITAVVLALALVAPAPAQGILLALQAAVFAVGAARGVQHTPYAALFRRLVRPRLGPPAELEDPAPPRFAQAVGLTFLLVALGSLALGASTVALVATGLALVAALLNAVVGLCLGCELHLILRRTLHRAG